jgi:hypothetical protein
MQPQQPEGNWQQPEYTPAQNAYSAEPDPAAAPAPSFQTGSDPTNNVVQSPNEADAELIRWQAHEELEYDRNGIWYMIFAAVTVLLIGIGVFLQAWTFAVLVLVMAIALFLYTRRPPQLITYILSRKGLHINDQLNHFESFKEFGILTDGNNHSLFLVPRKRFQPGTTVYFPEEIGEPLVDLLAARLPMRNMKLDIIDRLIRMLRI